MACPAARAGDVAGRVRFEGPGRPVLFLRGNGMVTTHRGGPVTHECTIRNGIPEPRTLLLRENDRVRFRNGDGTTRRLFLFSGAETRDAGPLEPGAAIERTFPAFGPVEIYTDAPGSPSSALLVMENPYFTEADSTGAFLLDGVTPGDYDVWAWLPPHRMDHVPVSIPLEGRVGAELILP